MRKIFTLLAVGAMAMSAHAIDYYVIGGFNNWATADAAAKFTDKGDGTFELDYNGTLTSGFKINDGTWSNPDANFGGNGSNLVLGETYTLTVGGTSPNIAMASNVENPHLVFNPTAKTLVVTGQGQAVEYTYAIHGQIFGEPVKWSSENMTEKNGKWVLENATVDAGSFGIKRNDKSTGSQLDWISADGNGAVTLESEAMTLTVTGEGSGPVPPVVPETLYILGNIDDNDWNPVNPIPMTKSGNTFTVEAEAVANVEGKSFFSFCSAKGSTNDNAGWGELSGSDRYGAATEGAVATVGTPFAYTVYKANVNASACKSWSIAPNTDGHKYKFTVDFDKQTVSVTMTSGVDSIEVENDGEAVYFNLQGVRVDNPENGIFVRVANGKAVKVVK